MPATVDFYNRRKGFEIPKGGGGPMGVKYEHRVGVHAPASVIWEMIQDVATYALDLQGAAGALSGPEDAEVAGKFQAMLLRAPGTRVEGGTDEIMRNIIAERVLGLPGDIRVDKDVPFNKIPTKGRA